MTERGDAAADPTTVVDAMVARDPQAAFLGFEVTRVVAGSVTVEMTIEQRHLGDHGLVHGGILFTLADVAMAYASNSYDVAALATGASINFVSGGHPGERLRATAIEHSLRGKAGIYDVTVHAADEGSSEDRLVATFRGQTLRVGGSVVNLTPRSPHQGEKSEKQT